MMIPKTLLLALAALVSSNLGAAQNNSLTQAYGPRYSPGHDNRPDRPRKGTEIVHRWNTIAINATGLDHTPPRPGEDRAYYEQLGPGRASRAMAMAHIALFDAYNATSGGKYRGYTSVAPARGNVSQEAAVAQAVHDTLVVLFPAQRNLLDASLEEDLSEVKNANARAAGVELGRRIAAELVALRQDDGSEKPEVFHGAGYSTSDQPGHWRQDPVSHEPLVLGAHWGACKTFVVESSAQFLAPPPPPMNSPEYTAAFNETKRLGGDGVQTPTERTEEQSFIGTFWAYDATPSLCAPPRLYNQLLVQVADNTKVKGIDLARLLAIANVAMADTAMTAWESKFHYDLWRPVTGIRESDLGTGPTGRGDGNPHTAGDPGWMPLGAPASNLNGPNFTPPFPTYPSGHASFGGALFQVLRRFYGTDRMPFTFVSDEFNGTTHDNQGNLRPYRPRSFRTFSEAEAENGRSRIYLGIHWSFDASAGIGLGRQVGDYVFEHVFRENKH